MRKAIYLFAALIVVVLSCNKEEHYINKLSDVSEERVVIRDLETATMWAEKSLSLLGPQTKNGASIRSIESHEVILRPGTKTGFSSSDTLLYVFNFEDSSGFSIIAANESEEPIIGIAEKGHYTKRHPSGVNGFDLYLAGVMERLSSERGPGQPFRWYEDVMVGDSVDRNVGVKWGQEDIYGQYCANYIAGCDPISIAQILAYHQNPSSFEASLSMDADFLVGETVLLNWAGIKTHVSSHSDPSACDVYHNTIGALIREIGYVANTDYSGTTGSSTSLSAIPGTFTYFGYNASSPSIVNISSLKSCIKSFGPVYMRGDRVEDNTLYGHSWVADGYKDFAYYHNGYSWATIGDEPFMFEHTLIRESHVLHINWGWNGNCNGYFNFDVYDIDNAVIYDDVHTISGRNYDTDVKMIVVYPVNPYQ